MRRIDRLMGRTESRMGLDDWQETLNWQGLRYPLSGITTWQTEKAEPIGNNFEAYVQNAYKANGVVFAVILARLALFTEATFKFRNLATKELFGGPSLLPLEAPWQNGTTSSLLAQMEQDVSLAGNSYHVRRLINGRPVVQHLRPDWVQVITNSPSGEPDDVDAWKAGLIYYPGGMASKKPPVLLPVSDNRISHFAPIPDPVARWRGMSWLTPVLVELQADQMATRHKRKFFENAATPNLAVSLSDQVSPEAFQKFVAQMAEKHDGFDNAYKTLYTGGGADVKVIGADMKQLEFKSTQGAGETRIAAAGGVPPIIVGLSEGLQASTYSNYGQARRKFGDHWARPQWREAAAALAPLVDVPSGSQLWYDPSDISFLQEDEKDTAEIHSLNASTIRTYVEAGFTPESAVQAVAADNATLLQHTGRVSVQLQDPNQTDSDRAATPEELTVMIQKIYLGVGTVLTADEARKILNDAGAGLGALPPGFGVEPAPAAPAAS